MPKRNQNSTGPGQPARDGRARAAREVRPGDVRAAREARSAESLRENLKRRKQQARLRSGEGGERHDDEGTGSGGAGA